MKVSVVVVAHNSGQVLLECLKHLCSTECNLELIVVDTSSTDGSVELAAQHYSFKHAKVANLGYAYAVNQGIALASQPVVVQMNADVYITPAQLRVLLQPLEDPKVALVGPVLVGTDGKPQKFGMASAASWISGAIMGLRRDVLEQLGGMDESFFFYNEDIAWCWRAKSLGLKVVQVPLEVVHLGAHSSGNNPKLKAHGVVGTARLLQLHHPHWAGLYHKWLLVQYAAYRLSKPSYAPHFKQALEHFGL